MADFGSGAVPGDFGGDGVFAGKRRRAKRAARPCDACRRRKSRCVTKGDSAVCTMCELRASACTFLQHPVERRSVAAPAGLSNANARSPAGTGAGSTLAVPVSSTNLAEPLWQARSASEQDARIGGETASGHNLSEARDRGLGTEPHRFAELYGLTSDSEPLLMRHRPFDTTSHEYLLETHSIRRVQQTDNGMKYPVVFHMVSDKKSIGYIDDYAEVDGIEAIVNPFGPRLVRLYWLLVQPSFPVLCQARFMQQFSDSYRHISAALLGAVYLQALAWWSYDSELSLRPQPDMGRLRKLTIDAIQASFHRPRLSSIQAMLIYLHCRPEEPLTADHTYARGLTSEMLAVSEAIGLHTDASDWMIPEWEKTERKRLSWAIYMQDKWTALAYGRPSHIVEDNWGVQDLTDTDFEDLDGPEEESSNFPGESTRSRGRSHFVLMVALTKILSHILSEFFTIKSSRDQDTSKLLEKAQPILDELVSWREKLNVSLPITPQRPRYLCPVGSIHLCYHGVIINLFRRLVRSTALAPLCSDPAVLSSIRQQAIQAAHEATNFVTSLRLDQLESFWYFPSPYLFALVGGFQTLLLVTSLGRTERDHWRETLNSFLWSLRIMSKASDPMRYAVNRLEGGVLRGLEHALAVNIDTPLRTPNVNPLDLDQLLQQLDSSQFAYTADYSDFGLQSFDWLNGVQIQYPT